MTADIYLIMNIIVLPAAAISAGLIASAEVILSAAPFLRKVVYALLQIRVPVGIISTAIGIVALIFPPGEPPVTGNLVPASAAILAGLSITPEVLLNDRHSRREYLILIWLKQALLRLRPAFGVLAILSGIFHILTPDKIWF